ncbi:MAG: BRCT domain-containing protein [Proteobacteria bacterium]|nr:BRCT domain-containing protein [Pseudomonadota bacterium]
MASEKVTRILKSQSHFADEEIAKMTDREGWAWIYGNRHSKKRDKNKHQICFTGFGLIEKDDFADIAMQAGMKVVSSVTKSLSFLCVGNSPGPSKLGKAKKQNVTILTEEQFNKMLETGELPE